MSPAQLQEATSPDGRSLRRERNADLLYDAASQLLATRSFEALSVDEICELAGVGRATFFRIFDTKTGLLREFNRRLAREAAARLAEEGTGVGPPQVGKTDIRAALEQIRRVIVDAWRDAGPGQLGMARAFIESYPGGNPHAAHPELLALVEEQVAGAVNDGQLPDSVPPDIAASLILINLITPIAYAIQGREVEIDRLSQVLLDQWLTGMTGG